MGTNDFQDRLNRIGGNAHSPADVGAPTAIKSKGFDVLRVLWGIFGVIWGMAANTMVIFANVNYDQAKLDGQASELTRMVAATGAVGIFSWLVFIILAASSFLFLRNKKGLRLLVFGFLLGVAIASTAIKISSIGGGIGI